MNHTKVITGFNTDIEHEGTVYHVQTEDKGLNSPLILSLVYVGGAILASKRSRYDDLIARGFDEKELAERLNRQHKLICAAIRAGRVDDLKRMSQRDTTPARAQTSTPAAEKSETESVTEEPQALKPLTEAVKASTAVETAKREDAPPQIESAKARQEARASLPEAKVKKAQPPKPQAGVRQTMRAILQDVVADFARAEAVSETALYLSLIGEKEFRGGQHVALQIKVGSGTGGSEAIAGADVTVKVLGSTFRPLIFPTQTGADGIATVRVVLPHFQTGRAAILIRAVANGYEAELRRIIHQG